MNERLQALRGVAVFLVLLQHGLVLNLVTPAGWFTSGWAGVYLFFVISGCVIADSLVRDEAHFGRFMVRRLFRLMPALFCFIALAWVLNWTLAKEIGYPLGPITESRFWIYAVATITGMVHPFNYFGWHAPIPFMFAHIWSLSVEDIFYLAFGALAGSILLKRSPQRTMWWLAGLALALLVVRALTWTNTLPWWMVNYMASQGDSTSIAIKLLVTPFMLPIMGGMDFIVAGVIVFCLARGRRLPNWLPERGLPVLLVLVVTASLLVLATTGNPVVSTSLGPLAIVGLPFAIIGFSLAVLLCWMDPRPITLWLGKVLKHLGDLSYGLYLLHLPIAVLVSSMLYRVDINWQALRATSFNITFFCVYVAISYVLALGMYHWVERPLITRGRRIAARIGRTAAAPVTVSA